MTARLSLLLLLMLLAVCGGTGRLLSQGNSVRITLPAAVTFAVTNVGIATQGSPSSTRVSFANLNVPGGQVLRVSIKADSDFSPPSGAAIPASRVSWTTSGANNGSGSAGTLSTVAYLQVFQSDPGRRNGRIDLSWRLAAPGVPVRAGNHSLRVRWRLESVTP